VNGSVASGAAAATPYVYGCTPAVLFGITVVKTNE